MAIEATLIWDEVKNIIASPNPVHFKWTCDLVANNTTVKPFRLVNLEINRDYHGNYADDVTLEVLVPYTDLFSFITPNESILEAVIYKTPLKENSNLTDTTQKIESQRFRATLISDGTTHVKTATPDNMSLEGADLTNLKTVRFQLVDQVTEQLRMAQCGGIYRKQVPADVLRAVLGAESAKVKTSAEQAVKGVDMIEPSNTTVMDHVMVPHGIPVVQLPMHIQRHCGGVYSTGIGYYLQKGYWYIYPEADMGRFTKSPKSLTVLSIPPDKLPGAERTYRETKNQVIVMSTGKMHQKDNTEKDQLNDGNGVRFTDANKIMDGFGTYNNGTYTVNRKGNSSEFIGLTRDTGLNKVPVSNNRLTANPFIEYSRIALRDCSYIICEWQNSNDSLIYPGMPAKYIYENNGVVSETMGVVFRAHHFITGDGNSMIDSNHKTTSVITLIVKM